MKKYPDDFKLTKKFKKYARFALKNWAEMVPVVGGPTGIVSSTPASKVLGVSPYL
jgi:hypothetical protein